MVVEGLRQNRMSIDYRGQADSGQALTFENRAVCYNSQPSESVLNARSSAIKLYLAVAVPETVIEGKIDADLDRALICV